MQAVLFVLTLMGQFFFFTCDVYKYHFINENKTWDEAQKYCNETHTDLAIVFDKADVERLRISAGNTQEGWIGLYSISGKDNRRWHWSMPGVEYKENMTWEPPHESTFSENCVKMKNTTWHDFPCSSTSNFICYNENKKDNKTFHVINETKTWRKAQRYCRENHTDLVSGIPQLKDEEVMQVVRAECFWIGLFRDTWRWSGGSNFSFRNWESDDEFSVDLSTTEPSNKTCALMSGSSGKWNCSNCSDAKPFFCYEDKVILVKKEKTWEEALEYCRKNHRELVSITGLNEQKFLEMKAKQANTDFVWTGLRYTCTLEFWFWITDEVVSYKNWAPAGRINGCDMSGAMDTRGNHTWISKPDVEKFNFICFGK